MIVLQVIQCFCVIKKRFSSNGFGKIFLRHKFGRSPLKLQLSQEVFKVAKNKTMIRKVKERFIF